MNKAQRKILKICDEKLESIFLDIIKEKVKQDLINNSKSLECSSSQLDVILNTVDNSFTELENSIEDGKDLK